MMRWIGRRHRWAGWAAASVLLGFVAATPAGGLGPGTPLSDADAKAWLSRINEAAHQRSYRGTMVFSADGVVSSSRVAHLCVGEQFIERVEALDGRQHRIYRHNEIVHTVWPRARLVVVGRRTAAAGLVAIRRTVEPRALAHYRVLAQGQRRIAGRQARVLLLEPRDEWRFAQRLWADEETGLLLRTDVLGPQARVLESSAFGEIEIAPKLTPETLLDGMKPAGYRVAPSANSVVELQAEGWALRHRLPGFELMGCLKRPMPAGRDGALLHAVFSDGVTFVSVFIEPFDEVRHTRALSAEMGATRTVMLRDGDHWITAMGDVPPQTLDLFVRALERRR